MTKILGPSFLVAGTAIGAGVLALPMTLAKLGLLPSIVLMVIIWLIMHYSSLVNLELNLRAGKGLPLGALGKHFSGRGGEVIGSTTLLLLTYSLMSAYLYGGTSITKDLIQHFFNIKTNFINVLIILTSFVSFTLALYTKWVERINRILFISLITLFIIIIINMLLNTNISTLPLFESEAIELNSWSLCIPVVFTSFGFQVIFHTLTNYCNKDHTVLKKVFFYGSLLTLIVYILWSVTIMSAIYNSAPEFYTQIKKGNVEVGQLIKVMSNITHWKQLKIVCWIISILAIITSIFGVGLGLIDKWKNQLKLNIKSDFKIHLLSLMLTIIPPFIIAAIIPKAFINALAFAGMILAIIAILLPIYLLKKSNAQGNVKTFYPLVKNKKAKELSIVFGILVITFEVMNLFGK